MNILKKHWQSILLVILALVIVRVEYTAVRFHQYPWQASAGLNPFFVAVGKWGIRFLLISLLMSPLYTLTNWRFTLKLRKPTGLIAFFFVSLHVGMYIYNSGHWAGDIGWIERFTQVNYILMGLVGFTILAAMAVTSFKPVMKIMGRWWKRLHRLVYGAGILVILHALIAATSGKRAGLGGQESAEELRLYLLLLTVLLILRIPIVKHTLQTVSPFNTRKRKEKPKRSVVAS